MFVKAIELKNTVPLTGIFEGEKVVQAQGDHSH